MCVWIVFFLLNNKYTHVKVGYINLLTWWLLYTRSHKGYGCASLLLFWNWDVPQHARSLLISGSSDRGVKDSRRDIGMYLKFQQFLSCSRPTDVSHWDQCVMLSHSRGRFCLSTERFWSVCQYRTNRTMLCLVRMTSCWCQVKLNKINFSKFQSNKRAEGSTWTTVYCSFYRPE